MGFYGNVSNSNKSTFQFDKVYSSRKAMEANKLTDNVYLGRYVLVEYDTDVSTSGCYAGYLKGATYEVATEYVASETYYALEDNVYIKKGTGSSVFGGKDNFEIYQSSNNPYYIQTSDGSSNFTGVIYQDSSCKIPYKYSTSYSTNNGSLYGIQEGSIVYVEVVTSGGATEKDFYCCETTDTKTFAAEYETAGSYDSSATYYILSNNVYVAKGTGSELFGSETAFEKAILTTTYYFQTQEEISNIAIFTKISNGTSSTTSNYATNYAIDKAYYEAFGVGTGRGWDSTVWQKVYSEGAVSYVMIAELNSVVPTFDISNDAPTTTPISPHFDDLSNNVYYKLHLQPMWGVRMRPAKAIYGPKMDSTNSTFGSTKIAYSSDTEIPSEYEAMWTKEVYGSDGNIKTYYYDESYGDWSEDPYRYDKIENFSAAKYDSNQTYYYGLEKIDWTYDKQEFTYSNGKIMHWTKDTTSGEWTKDAEYDGYIASSTNNSLNESQDAIFLYIEDTEKVYNSARTYFQKVYRHYNSAMYLNTAGFDAETIHYSSDDDVSSENYFELTPTGLSGNQYNLHDGSGGTSAQRDMQELSIMLPGVGDTMAQLWDLAYGNESQNGGKKRNLDVDWESAEYAVTRDGLRLVNGDYNYVYNEISLTPSSYEKNKYYYREKDSDGNVDSTTDPQFTHELAFNSNYVYYTQDTTNNVDGYTYSTDRVNTIAGCINSVHDLMGMIISDEGESIIPDELTSDQVKPKDENLIYYYPSDGSYRRKHQTWDYTSDRGSYHFERIDLCAHEYKPNYYYYTDASNIDNLGLILKSSSDAFDSTKYYIVYKYQNGTLLYRKVDKSLIEADYKKLINYGTDTKGISYKIYAVKNEYLATYTNPQDLLPASEGDCNVATDETINPNYLYYVKVSDHITYTKVDLAQYTPSTYYYKTSQGDYSLDNSMSASNKNYYAYNKKTEDSSNIVEVDTEYVPGAFYTKTVDSTYNTENYYLDESETGSTDLNVVYYTITDQEQATRYLYISGLTPETPYTYSSSSESVVWTNPETNKEEKTTAVYPYIKNFYNSNPYVNTEDRPVFYKLVKSGNGGQLAAPVDGISVKKLFETAAEFNKVKATYGSNFQLYVATVNEDAEPDEIITFVANDYSTIESYCYKKQSITVVSSDVVCVDSSVGVRYFYPVTVTKSQVESNYTSYYFYNSTGNLATNASYQSGKTYYRELKIDGQTTPQICYDYSCVYTADDDYSLISWKQEAKAGGTSYVYNEDTQQMELVITKAEWKPISCYPVKLILIEFPTASNPNPTKYYRIPADSKDYIQVTEDYLRQNILGNLAVIEVTVFNENGAVDTTHSYTTKPTYINLYTITPNQEGAVYEAGKYWYQDEDTLNWLIDRNSSPVSATHYYNVYMDLVTAAWYQADKYYYDTEHNYNSTHTGETEDFCSMTLDLSNSLTAGRYYYEKEGLYVYYDVNGIMRKGTPWNDTMTTVPAKLILGERKPKYEMIPIYSFARMLNTIHGLILKVNQMLEYGDKETRNCSTVQGAINNINDIIYKIESLKPQNLMIVDAYGRMHGASLEDTHWTHADVDDSIGDPKVYIRHSKPYDPYWKDFEYISLADEENENLTEIYAEPQSVSVDLNDDISSIEIPNPIVDNNGHTVYENKKVATKVLDTSGKETNQFTWAYDEDVHQLDSIKYTLPYEYSKVKVNDTLLESKKAQDTINITTSDMIATTITNTHMAAVRTKLNELIADKKANYTYLLTQSEWDSYYADYTTAFASELTIDQLREKLKTLASAKISALADVCYKKPSILGDTEAAKAYYTENIVKADEEALIKAFADCTDSVNIYHVAPTTKTITSSDLSPTFGDTITITDLSFDYLGHKNGETSHTIKIPGLTYTDDKDANDDVVTDISYTYNATKNQGEFTEYRNEVGKLPITSYKEADTSVTTANLKLATSDSINSAFGKLQRQIDNMDYELFNSDDTAKASGEVIVNAKQVDGQITTTKMSVKDLKLVGYTTTATGVITADQTLAEALDAVEQNIDVIETDVDNLEKAVDDLEYTDDAATATQVVYKVTQSNGQIAVSHTTAGSLALNHHTNLDALDNAVYILNSDASTEGSVAKQVNDAVISLVDGAPDALNTLNEIADWIANQDAEGEVTDAASLIAKVDANTNKIGVESAAATSDVYYTQAEIDAASEGDAAYGKTTSDIKTAGTAAVEATGIYSRIEEIEEHQISDSTTLTYTYDGVSKEMTMQEIVDYISTLESRIYTLENMLKYTTTDDVVDAEILQKS